MQQQNQIPSQRIKNLYEQSTGIKVQNTDKYQKMYSSLKDNNKNNDKKLYSNNSYIIESQTVKDFHKQIQTNIFSRISKNLTKNKSVESQKQSTSRLIQQVRNQIIVSQKIISQEINGYNHKISGRHSCSKDQENKLKNRYYLTKNTNKNINKKNNKLKIIQQSLNEPKIIKNLTMVNKCSRKRYISMINPMKDYVSRKISNINFKQSTDNFLSALFEQKKKYQKIYSTNSSEIKSLIKYKNQDNSSYQDGTQIIKIVKQSVQNLIIDNDNSQFLKNTIKKKIIKEDQMDKNVRKIPVRNKKLMLKYLNFSN